MKLRCDIILSTSDFKINLRRYSVGLSDERVAMVGGAVLLFLQTLLIAFMILLKATPTEGWQRHQQEWVSLVIAMVVTKLCFAAIWVQRRRRAAAAAAPMFKGAVKFNLLPLAATAGRSAMAGKSQGLSSFDGIEMMEEERGEEEERGKEEVEEGEEREGGEEGEAGAGLLQRSYAPEGSGTASDTQVLAAQGGGQRSGTASDTQGLVGGDKGSGGGGGGRVGMTPNDYVFRSLLVYVAALESFAHGANDTANSTGPFSAIWETYSTAGAYTRPLFSASSEPFLSLKTSPKRLNTPSTPAINTPKHPLNTPCPTNSA